MDKAHTRSVIQRHALIPRSVSQEMLRLAADVKGHRKREPELRLNASDLEHLRSVYAAYRARCSDSTPRNLPFYLALKDKYPDLGWEVIDRPRQGSRMRQDVVLRLPRINGVLPSLAALLLQDLSLIVDADEHLHAKGASRSAGCGP